MEEVFKVEMDQDIMWKVIKTKVKADHRVDLEKEVMIQYYPEKFQMGVFYMVEVWKM